MKSVFYFGLFFLLSTLSACHGPEGNSPVRPSETTQQTNAPPNQGNTPPVSSEGQPSAPPTASHVASGPEPTLNTDYTVIEGGQAFQPIANKIEVTEIFGYVCPACFVFHSVLGPWKAGLPSDVHFVYVPAMFGGTWDDYARAFYAADALGILEKTHDPLYRAIHVDHTLQGESGHDSVQDIANFYAHYGVNAKQFIETMTSFGVAAKTNSASQFARRSQIPGTPSLIIDGKYLVKGHSFEDMLRIADHLIARERAALAQNH